MNDARLTYALNCRPPSELSAFIVLLSLLIGAELGGLFGMLVAVPVAGVLRVIGLRVVRAPETK